MISQKNAMSGSIAKNALALACAAALAFAAASAISLANATQAQAKSMYVIASAKSSYGVTKYTYNKKGLITKFTPGDYGYPIVLKYDSKNQVKTRKATKGSLAKLPYTFTYNSKGLMITKSCPQWGGGTMTWHYAYTSTGKLKSSYRQFNHGEKQFKSTYKVNKAKRVTVWNLKGAITKYTYDKHGNLIKEKSGGSILDTYKNTYKNGRIISQLQKVDYGDEDGVTETLTTYTYKKISVPSNCVKKVKAQQWEIVNRALAQIVTY